MIHGNLTVGTLFFTIICALTFMTPAYGNVRTGTDTAINYTMEYPIIYTDNKNIQNIINEDISSYIQNFKNSYATGDFINGNFKYEVKYEDKNYVSLIIYEYKWTGGAHGQSIYIGLNYDKQTGQNIPLSYFVKLRPEDNGMVYQLPVYNEKNEIIPHGQLNPYRFQAKISGNYYLLGNGDIALIYQPYQMASYAIGVTHIALTVKWQDYFNRKNQ